MKRNSMSMTLIEILSLIVEILFLIGLSAACFYFLWNSRYVESILCMLLMQMIRLLDEVVCIRRSIDVSSKRLELSRLTDPGERP